LGGLALAVGILVDEATVTIENIHTRLADGRSLARAVSEATAETTLPRFVAKTPFSVGYARGTIGSRAPS
jgi:multidrug efflux pump subunit AcrB